VSRYVKGKLPQPRAWFDEDEPFRPSQPSPRYRSQLFPKRKELNQCNKCTSCGLATALQNPERPGSLP
jgi:hypothetical protein